MTRIVDRRELMAMHIDALYTWDAKGRMLRVNEPNGKPAPRFCLGRTADGNIWRFRHDVSERTVAELEAASAAEPAADAPRSSPLDARLYTEILARESPVEATLAGLAYAFPPTLRKSAGVVHVTEANMDLLEPLLDAWLGDVYTAQPLMALVEDGRAVSVCASVRITDRGHEAGVDTHPEYRGRGFAGRVVSEWAIAVRGLNRVPLYSTSWENTASQAVARKLGLVMFGDDLNIA